ncbi:MAG: RNA-binding transcriptional accessory protein [Muribaculaceae bacterium]|nr:RNA-binding transcriptional accessory protein [Muribaculaceae bacterium]
MNKNIASAVAERTALPIKGVAAVIELLDEGATVPFISRYRKERTGSLDEVSIRSIETALKQVRDLEARREFIIGAIESVQAMTPAIRQRLIEASSMTELEDVYAPFKPKKRTRATIAREKGLEPLAKRIMSGHLPPSSDDEIASAMDIIAEWASESSRLRNITRNAFNRSASLLCTVAKGKEEEIGSSSLAQYADFSQSVRRMQSHQYLALRRAEREGLVKVRYSLGDAADNLDDSLCRAFVPRQASGECREIIEEAVEDASKRLLKPSVENEISASLKENADKVAIDIFSANLRQLLLASPLKGKRVLAIDPGYRTGCKVVALDAQGNLLDEGVIYPTPPKNDIEGAKRILERLVRKHHLEVVSLGNGTASRETERFLKSASIVEPSKIFIVSEDGASVYSASELARKEFPDKDVTVRGAVSIGRRLIDPLAELVKIDPKSIGVGQYQHDVDQTALRNALDYTVMSCVNSVGVDVNTASERLLSYVSGIGPALAANIVAYRAANGDFKSRRDLKKVPRLGDKAFELCAGFLRVPGGKEPLDNTGIHPESYGIVDKMARSLNVKAADLPANDSLLNRLDLKALADAGVGGIETMTDIVKELRKPGRDPRTDDNSGAFVPEIDDFSQLSVGRTLPGVVNNITAFGAFVDLGIKENGLIHISRLGRRVNAVTEILSLGQRLEVKVIDIDSARKRISLELLSSAK